MPRHAKTKSNKRVIYRSPDAQAAYNAGLVTNTIVLGRAPADDVRMRVIRTLNRHAAALIVVGAAFWIYDIGLLLTH